jgi:ParB family transcriptional regulator, chromosome partitioning protein
MQATPSQSLVQLHIDDLVLSPYNPRKSLDPAGLKDLLESISQSGIRTPLLVRNIGGKAPHYEVMAGARRLTVARELLLATVPCLVHEGIEDEQARDIAILDNLQRADVHPAEEAEAYRNMIDRTPGGLTAEDIAKRVGKAASYVATRLKLLELELEAKLLFIKGHITLGHALLLARLTPADQERAICFMLDVDRKYDKRPITEVVRGKLGIRAEPLPGEEEDVDDEDEDEGVSYNMPNPQVAKYMRFGRRLIDATEMQLKKWIESNVLLQLKAAPWRLDDADLVPAAGACVDCPKRSGSNAALFGDMTAEADICLDTVCYSAKQDATVKVHKEAAKGWAKLEGVGKGAGLLLKISAKGSQAPLEELAVEGGQVITKKTVKAGQWVPTAGKNCENVVKALAIDGPDKGKLLEVCADQKCKTHKHEIRRPYSGSSSRPEDPAKAAAEAAKKIAYVESETAIRVAIYQAVRKFVEPSTELIRQVVLQTLQEYSAPAICKVLALSIRTKGDIWEIRRDAAKVLKEYVIKATGPQLHLLLFDALNIEAIKVNEYNMSSNKKDREQLWILARKYKVDADKIAVGPSKAATKPMGIEAPIGSKTRAKAAKKLAATPRVKQLMATAAKKAKPKK